MASDWDTYPISDFVTLSQGLAINAKSKYLLEETGLPLLRITDLINGTQVHFVNEEKAPPKCIATDHELIYTRTGQVGLVYRNKVGVVHNNCFKVIPSPELDKDFLYWFLFQESTKAHVNAVASGSVQKDLNHAAFLTLSIPKPELSEQKAIASILDSLDDKIELNRQMNETLEAMAQALFKSWFVDFDPVIDNALAAGNAIPDEFIERAEQRKGIEKKDNSEIQSLFPDEFEFTEEMGWIPKGWASDTVKELANVTDYVANGSFASLKENVTLSDDPEYALYIRTTDYKNDFSLAKAKYVNKQSYDFLKKSILEGYEVIISNVGDTGTVFRPPVWLNQPMTLGSNAIAIKNEDMSNFLQYYFSSYFGQYQISSIVGGSAQPKFNKTDFRALAVYFGSLELVSKFEEACQPLRAKIDTNLSQILLLSNIRDTLLPKLMSGELRIPDATALVENV